MTNIYFALFEYDEYNFVEAGTALGRASVQVAIHASKYSALCAWVCGNFESMINTFP